MPVHCGRRRARGQWLAGWLRQLELGLFECPFHGQAAIRRTATQLRQHALTTVPIMVAASSGFVLVEVHHAGLSRKAVSWAPNGRVDHMRV